MVGLFNFWWLVVSRAWRDTWGIVMRHNWATAARDCALAITALGLLFFFHDRLVSSAGMSPDNTRDTVLWGIIGLSSLVTLFGIVFAVQTVFLVPYKLWRDEHLAKEGQSYTANMVGHVGPPPPRNDKMADFVLFVVRFLKGDPEVEGLHVLACEIKARERICLTKIVVLANMPGRNPSYEIVAYSSPKELVAGEAVRFVLLHQRLGVGAFWGDPIPATEQANSTNLSESDKTECLRRSIYLDGPINIKIVASRESGKQIERCVSMLAVSNRQILNILDDAKIEPYDPERIIPLTGTYTK
jgi:hypothetical protein